MASVVCWFFVMATFYETVYGGVHADCGFPLGMHNRRIADKQITASHWLYFTHKSPAKHYEPPFARLNLNSVSGAWCSESIFDYTNQYIQIDLLVNTKVTGIATQGRSNSIEYTEAYQLTFQRDKESVFRKYKESHVWKEFKGNFDNKSTVKIDFKHPIIARKLRIYPRGTEFSIYCLRLELYGCKWAHRINDIMSYTAPLGSLIRGIDTRDYETYDGNISLAQNTISNGLGKLTDDIYGNAYLHRADSDTSAWVCYNTKDPVITFELYKKRLIRKVMIHVQNNGKLIRIFRRAVISMGTKNSNFSVVTEYTSNTAQMEKPGAFAVVIDLGEVLTKFIRIQFIKNSAWLLVSEILFITDDYPSKRVYPVGVEQTVSPAIYYTQSKGNQEEGLVDNEEPTKMGASSKGLSFPIIITITLLSSALFIVITVVIYKTFVTKKPSHVKKPCNQVPPPSQILITDKQAVSLLYDQTLKYHEKALLEHARYTQCPPQSQRLKGVIS